MKRTRSTLAGWLCGASSIALLCVGCAPDDSSAVPSTESAAKSAAVTESSPTNSAVTSTATSTATHERDAMLESGLEFELELRREGGRRVGLLTPVRDASVSSDGVRRQEFSVNFESQLVTVIVTEWTESHDGEQWQHARCALTGLTSGLEVVARMPTRTRDGSQRRIEVNGAQLEVSRDALDAAITLARDEATDIALLEP